MRKMFHVMMPSLYLSCHYCDVIMCAMASQITSLTIVYSSFIQAQIKENTDAPRHWPLWGEFTVTGEIPAQIALNAENVSIWWRHNVSLLVAPQTEPRHPPIWPGIPMCWRIRQQLWQKLSTVGTLTAETTAWTVRPRYRCPSKTD